MVINQEVKDLLIEIESSSADTENWTPKKAVKDIWNFLSSGIKPE